MQKQTSHEHNDHAHGANAHSEHTHDAHEPNSHTHDDHEHGDHEHGDHDHASTKWGWLGTFFHSHNHSHDHGGLSTDQAFLDNQIGIRTVWMALGLLLVTMLLQLVIVWLSGSVALLADTAHNLVDALNSLPLLLAFYLARRPANRRYNYGFGKAEDVAGVLIVLSIAFSAGYIFWESIPKLFNPQPLRDVGWVAIAAIIGALGNEAVAFLQIRAGRQIGSAAMVADGLHARTDGLTSLAVLLAAGGSWLGYPIVDPLIGVVIGIVILFITRDAAKTMWYRLMDAIEPQQLDVAEALVAQQAGVRRVGRVRMRWMGSRLHAEVHVGVDANLTVRQGHAIAERVRHALFHEVARVAEVVVHVEPQAHGPADGALPDEDHQETAHHEGPPQRLQ
jgi:cation diffusion facilitator family transporter